MFTSLHNRVIAGRTIDHPEVRRVARRAAPRIECLEGRELKTAGISLGGGYLNIEGSEKADTVKVTQVADNSILVVANFNGQAQAKAYQASSVKIINFAGHSGNDDLENLTSIPSNMDGGDGNDTLVGGSSKDIIYGGSGSDLINAGAGDDLVFGGDGNDVILGGLGTDILHGGDGDDYLDGGNDSSFDILYGEGGLDTFRRNLAKTGGVVTFDIVVDLQPDETVMP